MPEKPEILDFYNLMRTKKGGDKGYVVWPDFQNGTSKDLMIRGGDFYAIWDPRVGLWSTKPGTVIELIDEELLAVAEELRSEVEVPVKVQTLRRDSSGVMEAISAICEIATRELPTT